MATRRKATPMYTVVQHSGFGYKKNPIFKNALETRIVTTAQQQDTVRRASGLLFDSYAKAEEFADKEMYPESVVGLVPQAPGTFSEKLVDWLCIYIPVKTEED